MLMMEYLVGDKGDINRYLVGRLDWGSVMYLAGLKAIEPTICKVFNTEMTFELPRPFICVLYMHS